MSVGSVLNTISIKQFHAIKHSSSKHSVAIIATLAFSPQCLLLAVLYAGVRRPGYEAQHAEHDLLLMG